MMKPSPPEEAGAQLLLEKDGQLDARLAGQEAALLHHQLPARTDVKGPDAAREAGGKGDQSLAALGGVAVLEDGVAGEHPPKRLPQTAVGAGLHLHVGGHPAHAPRSVSMVSPPPAGRSPPAAVLPRSDIPWCAPFSSRPGAGFLHSTGAAASCQSKPGGFPGPYRNFTAPASKRMPGLCCAQYSTTPV